MQKQIQNVIQESRTKYILQQKQKDIYYNLKKNKELEKIYETILKNLKNKNIVNGNINFDLRLKYWQNKFFNMNESDLFKRLNEMFIEKQGLELKDITLMKTIYGEDDECGICFVSSMCCCCIPLPYWLIKWYKNDKYGKLYTITIYFK